MFSFFSNVFFFYMMFKIDIGFFFNYYYYFLCFVFFFLSFVSLSRVHCCNLLSLGFFDIVITVVVCLAFLVCSDIPGHLHMWQCVGDFEVKVH